MPAAARWLGWRCGVRDTDVLCLRVCLALVVKKKGNKEVASDRGSRGKDETAQLGGTLRQTTELRQ